MGLGWLVSAVRCRWCRRPYIARQQDGARLCLVCDLPDVMA